MTKKSRLHDSTQPNELAIDRPKEIGKSGKNPGLVISGVWVKRDSPAGGRHFIRLALMTDVILLNVAVVDGLQRVI